MARWYGSRLVSRARSWEELDRGLRLIAAEPRIRIVAGPWTGSVEHELLYWIPFLRWFADTHQIDASRMAAITSTGDAVWYRDCAAYLGGGATTKKAVRLAPDGFVRLARAYREGSAPLRPLLRHARYVPVIADPPPPAATGPWCREIWVRISSGLSTVVVTTGGKDALTPDAEVWRRYARALGASLVILDRSQALEASSLLARSWAPRGGAGGPG